METKNWAFVLIICCTIFTSFGQLFWKQGADILSMTIPGLLSNWQILLGFLLYGIGLLLFVLSLKGGELSVLFPFISLSFIWVSILALVFLGETMSLTNWIGVIAIVSGVSFIGRGKDE